MNVTYKLPESLPADLERMRAEVAKFKNNETTAAEFRSFRVPQGVYEERQEGAFMLRVRLPAGTVVPEQMRRLAEVSRRYGDGVLHVTTRQDIQVHAVDLDGICGGLEDLAEAGLSARGGGGNGPRNITACQDAGVCVNELFDVRPYAVALTELLLDNPENFKLPRKYKIALAGCHADCPGAIVNDLGLIAKKRDGTPGFAVYVGGGMGARSRTGTLIEEFVPAQKCYRVAEAVKRVFDAHGNRRDKHKARLRFLIEQMGFERFRDLYRAELKGLEDESVPELKLKDMPSPRPERKPGDVDAASAGFDTWKERNVSAQKQDGFSGVSIPLVLGDIEADTISGLSRVVERYGDGILRTTQWQNLRMQSVSTPDLSALYGELMELGLTGSGPEVMHNTTSCTGAQTCKLGICLSRGMARAITKEIGRMEGAAEDLAGVNISISGCPNSCGRHPIADIGLHGAARRIGGRLTPQYNVEVGGQLGEGRTRLAEKVEVLHARNVPGFVVEFLQAFRDSPSYPDYEAFLEDGGRELAAQVASRHQHVPSFEEDKNYYYDWGAEGMFSLAGRGPGECGAGVFDLIEVDLESAREALQQGELVSATALAARALLVTRGEEAQDNLEALDLFEQHFIDAGLISERARQTVDLARRCCPGEVAEEEAGIDAENVEGLIKRVQQLYDNMDQSLKFDQPAPPAPEEPQADEQPPADVVEADKEADFRGVACPLNYVKTKMELTPMQSGQVLCVLVDEEGCKNVPESVEKDGHEVVDISPDGEHYRITIRKQ